MTYRGHFQKGQVVLDEPADLPDGTPVRIAAIAAYDNGTGSAAEIVAAIVPWAGTDEELDRLLGEVQATRDQDVVPTRDALE